MPVIMRGNTIVAMRAKGDYTRVFAANGPAVLAGQSLAKIGAQMPTPPFLRLSRSLMLNTDRLVEIESIDCDNGVRSIQKFPSELADARAKRG